MLKNIILAAYQFFIDACRNAQDYHNLIGLSSKPLMSHEEWETIDLELNEEYIFFYHAHHDILCPVSAEDFEEMAALFA